MKKQVRLLDFAVCPNNHARRPEFYAEFMREWACESCHVPSPFVTPKNSKICASCYFSMWWHLKVAKNKQMIQLA